MPSTPASSVHLINDLDLRVDGAGGGWQGNSFLYGESFHLGDPDRLNTVEGVLVKDPAPGTYAIKAYHDRNGNGRLDTGAFGAPVEPYGFSNDARGTFGPPPFTAATFTLPAAGTTVRFSVR